MAHITPLPLRHYTRHRHPEADARELLQSGADVNAKGNYNNTPLHCASNERVVQILVDHGADPNAQNSYNRTPLYEEVKSGCPEVAHTLLDQGAAPNSPDIERRTPLHLASGAGCTKSLRLLLRRDSDVHARDASHSSFSFCSTSAWHPEILLSFSHSSLSVRSVRWH